MFDTDIKMHTGGSIERMLIQLKPHTYGVGSVCQTNRSGLNVNRGVKYLHPHFMLLNLRKYFEWNKFVHHGAPCYKAMNQIHDYKMSNILIDFPVSKYIKHDWRGTRNLKPRLFKKQWE